MRAIITFLRHMRARIIADLDVAHQVAQGAGGSGLAYILALGYAFSPLDSALDRFFHGLLDALVKRNSGSR